MERFELTDSKSMNSLKDVPMTQISVNADL